MSRPGFSNFSRLTLLAALPLAAGLTGCGSSGESATTSALPSDESRATTIVRAAMSQASWRDVDDLEYAATVADDGRTACVDGKARHGKERFGFGEEWVHWDVDLADESITEAEQELAGASPGLCAGTFATLRMYDAVSFIAKQSPTTKAAFEEDPRLVATTVAAWRLDGQRICVATTEDGEISTDTGYILVSTTETGKHVEDDDSVTINSDDPACTEPPARTAPLVAIEELAEDSDEEDATADACRSFPDMPGCENN